MTRNIIVKIIGIFCISISSLAFGVSDRFAQVYEANKQNIIAKDQSIMNEFYTMFGITADQFGQFKQACRPAFLEGEAEEIRAVGARCSLPLSSDIREIIENMLKKSGINRPILILRDNSPDGADIQAKHSAILVTEETFNRLNVSQHEKEVTLLHEIKHLEFEDSLTAFSLKALKNKYLGIKTPHLDSNWFQRAWATLKITFTHKFDPKTWNGLVDRWMRFREERADALALINTDYLKARIEFWRRYTRTCCTNDDEHDDPAIRASRAERMLAEIEGRS